jgi:asparaginyl-tRNA synthetase
MVEPEMAYAQLDDVMNLGEGLINFIVRRVLNDRQEELKVLERDVSKLEAIVENKFPRLHYDEAVKILQEGFAKGELENNFEWGGDFGAPDETYISNQFNQPVFVHHFPAAIKAFYFERDAERPNCARRRPARARRLRRNHRRRRTRDESRISRTNNSPNTICRANLLNGIWICAVSVQVPHAGFGMGVERCTAWMCGIEHVRETIPFPRMLYRLKTVIEYENNNFNFCVSNFIVLCQSR